MFKFSRRRGRYNGRICSKNHLTQPIKIVGRDDRQMAKVKLSTENDDLLTVFSEKKIN